METIGLNNQEENDAYKKWQGLENLNDVNQNVNQEIDDSQEEREKQQETAMELRNRFLDEDYGDMDANRLGVKDTILYYMIPGLSTVDSMDWMNASLKSMAHINERDDKRERLEAITRFTKEWSPYAIADKYGDKVEQYGISLADINLVTSRFVMNSYERFCMMLPNIIERHFSDTVPEDDKNTMASIVRAISEKMRTPPEERDSRFFDERSLSDKECNYIANLAINEIKGNDDLPLLHKKYWPQGIRNYEESHETKDDLLCGILRHYQDLEQVNCDPEDYRVILSKVESAKDSTKTEKLHQ